MNKENGAKRLDGCVTPGTKTYCKRVLERETEVGAQTLVSGSTSNSQVAKYIPTLKTLQS